MPRKIIQRYLPDHRLIRENRSLQFLGDHLIDPNLWHLNRRSVSMAFAVGLFVAWIPIVGQMLIAASAAILFRANLPISVGLVFVTNPITTAPFFYFAYLVGVWMLQKPPQIDTFNFEFNELLTVFESIWQPFLLGCLIVGIVSAVLGYGSVRVLWRMYVLNQWQQRKLGQRGKFK